MKSKETLRVLNMSKAVCVIALIGLQIVSAESQAAVRCKLWTCQMPDEIPGLGPFYKVGLSPDEIKSGINPGYIDALASYGEQLTCSRVSVNDCKSAGEDFQGQIQHEEAVDRIALHAMNTWNPSNEESADVQERGYRTIVQDFKRHKRENGIFETGK